MVLPPVLFYAIGGLLAVFGALRIVHLGLRRSHREIADGEASPARQKQRRYHVVVGAIWLAMGLFLVLSTAGVFRYPR